MGISFGNTQIIATTNDGHFTDMVSVTVGGSSADDSIALVKLHKIAYLPYWDLTKPMDQWEGVVLNSDRRVVNIETVIFITAPLDASIGNLTCLKQLYMRTDYNINNITIPAEIGKLTDLEYLFFIAGFTGTIPPELGKLTKLKNLEIYETQLIGNIPPELGNLSKLEVLRLEHNKLTGKIPQELENLRNLQELNLQYNSLSGTIPQSLLDRFDYWSFCPQNGTNFDNLDCGW
jgi:Leucine-rich repeat (LRR) protein